MSRRTLFVVVALVLGHLLLHVVLGFGRGAPDLYLVALLIGSRSLGVAGGAGLGFGLGLLDDAFSALSFGANVFAMTVTGAMGSRSRDLFVGDSFSFLVAYFVFGKWVRDLLAWTVSDSITRPRFGSYVLVESPLMALYAAVVGLAVVLVLVDRLEGSE